MLFVCLIFSSHDVDPTQCEQITFKRTPALEEWSSCGGQADTQMARSATLMNSQTFCLLTDGQGPVPQVRLRWVNYGLHFSYHLLPRIGGLCSKAADHDTRGIWVQMLSAKPWVQGEAVKMADSNRYHEDVDCEVLADATCEIQEPCKHWLQILHWTTPEDDQERCNL